LEIIAIPEKRLMETREKKIDPSPMIIHGGNQQMLLDINTIKELWSKTYNANGKPDWSHIFPYYHPDVVFQDPIQRIEGLEEFVALCGRLTKRCEMLQMEILSIAQNSNTILMDWKMTMAFKKYPSTPVYGSTMLRLHEDGRIIHQRDYFDLWGEIFNGIPYFKKHYRKFMYKSFG
jgi:limonene-1,2-epoxide hydrolase